jgi:DNA repair exonuclease SbcCD ATPase subunit
MMNTHQKTIRAALFFLAVSLLSVAPVTMGAQSAKDSEEVSGLLAEAKAESIQLKQDAEEMNGFVRSTKSWQTHASKLNEIKQHANKLGELVAKMNDAKATASPWQRQSIDRITPLLRELAGSVTATIKQLSDNQNRLQHPPFPD